MGTQVKYLTQRAVLPLAAGVLLLGLSCDTWPGPWRIYKIEGLGENVGIRVIYFLAPDDGWASDGYNSIFRFDGERWYKYKYISLPGSVTVLISAIDFTSADDGWFVGSKHLGDTPVPGLILHYDGADWKDVTPPGMPPLGSVCALAPDDVWVAGAGGIYHYDGATWRQYLKDITIRALHLSSPNNGWATSGYGGYFHWDGASWELSDSLDLEKRNDIFCPTDDSAWAVGGGFSEGEIPADKIIYYYKTGMPYWKPWPSLPPEAEHKSLEAVHFAAPDDGWAAGQVVLRWDGEKWDYVPCPYFAYDVFTLGGNEVWLACEDGYILKYNPK